MGSYNESLDQNELGHPLLNAGASSIDGACSMQCLCLTRKILHTLKFHMSLRL